MNHQDFTKAYRRLEGRMREQARKDHAAYIPNPMPSGPVDYIFVCMEPTLGAWARRKSEADCLVNNGFRNFLNGKDIMILHFSIRRFLCEGDERYHITDCSKGAMPVELAVEGRLKRYHRWYPLLVKEIQLLATDRTEVFAVGKVVEDFLNRVSFWRATPLPHYSPQANGNRKKVLKVHKKAFNEFKETVHRDDVLAVAHEVVSKSQVPDEIRKLVFETLERGDLLTESRLLLMFNYKLAFDAFLHKPSS